MRWVRHRVPEAAPLGLGGRELVVEALKLLLQRARAIDVFLRRGFAEAPLLGARLVAALRGLGPSAVGGQERVECPCGALSREGVSEEAGGFLDRSAASVNDQHVRRAIKIHFEGLANSGFMAMNLE